MVAGLFPFKTHNGMRVSGWLLGVMGVLMVLPGARPGGYGVAADTEEKHIVFVIGEREYQTRHTLPAFAEQHLMPRGFRCTFVFADSTDRNAFPGLEAIADADLLVLSVRRRTLKRASLALLRDYLDEGGPMVALRTSSHAFHQRRDAPPPGHDEWRTFDEPARGEETVFLIANTRRAGMKVRLRDFQGASPITREVEGVSAGVPFTPIPLGGTLAMDHLGEEQVLLLRREVDLGSLSLISYPKARM